MCAKAATTPKRPECRICEKSFQTNVQLVKHSVSTNHGADRCCVPCSRIFGTKEGLEAHSRSSVHAKPPSVRVGPPKKPPKVLDSPAGPLSTRKQECSICHQFFETKAQLAEHCLHFGHAQDRCCRPCRRLFVTKEALKAHEKTLACKGSACPDIKKTSPQSLEQKHWINCRGNSYRKIPQQNQIEVLGSLLARCHPTSSLQRHGYNASQADGSQQRDGPALLAQEAGEHILPLPRRDNTRITRKAVAIDCEMVGVEGRKSELVSLSVIDFLTGEQIINSLVKPRRPIRDWRTNIHGISPAVLAMARAKGQTLDGWQSARNELFKYIDEDTVLVGHALHHDLAVLHIHPDRVVDSIILASDAVFSESKRKTQYWGLGLKSICSELLQLDIRVNTPGSTKAHDALEDALAAREVVLCCLEQSSTYETWAAEKREAFLVAQARSATQKRQKARRKQHLQKSKANAAYVEDSEDDILRWEDVIDYEMWPKSPPDSD